MKTKTRFHKFTAWLLTVAMLMTFIPSFTLTAFAAEDTTATITGLKVDVDGMNYESGTVTLTPESGDVTIIFTGTNLQNADENNLVMYYNGQTSVVVLQGDDANADGTEVRLFFHPTAFEGATAEYEIKYSNDNMTTLIGSGISFNYDAGTKEPVTYTVAIADTTNGTVTADKENAAAGDTVTLTVTPAPRYELDTLTVKDADNGNVTVTDNKFTMPAKNVTVSATFVEKIPVIESLTFNSDSEAYAAATKTFYYYAEHTLELTVTGENLLYWILEIGFENSEGGSLFLPGSGHA